MGCFQTVVTYKRELEDYLCGKPLLDIGLRVKWAVL